MFSEIHFTCQLLKFSAFTNSWHVPRPSPQAPVSHPPATPEGCDARSRDVHARPPRAPAQKNLLPYPLKGWCTEQGDRSSPLIPFYPSGFSNKCAPQAFNLWPLHLPAPQSCKKKKSSRNLRAVLTHAFLPCVSLPPSPPPLSLSLGVDPWASALVSHRVLWLWDG